MGCGKKLKKKKKGKKLEIQKVCVGIVEGGVEKEEEEVLMKSKQSAMASAQKELERRKDLSLVACAPELEEPFDDLPLFLMSTMERRHQFKIRNSHPNFDRSFDTDSLLEVSRKPLRDRLGRRLILSYVIGSIINSIRIFIFWWPSPFVSSEKECSESLTQLHEEYHYLYVQMEIYMWRLDFILVVCSLFSHQTGVN